MRPGMVSQASLIGADHCLSKLFRFDVDEPKNRRQA
jgi:hypothetical protein